MPVLNLLNEDFQSYSSDQNQSKMINMYLEKDTSQGKYEWNALPTPGLTVFATINSPVRAAFEEHNILYAVGGNTFYSIASNGTPTTIGTLDTSTGIVNISGINNEILVTDGTSGHVYNISANTWTKVKTVTDGGLVNTANVTAVGSGYTSGTISVAFSGGSGSGAAATAVLSGGQVTELIITATGSGYNTAPTITINDSGSGTGATATCTITTNAFPTTTNSTCAQDEIMIALDPATQTWQISDTGDAFTYEPLNFASTTGNQNNLVGVASLQRQIWLFSENSTEIWYNAGLVNFPFLRRPDAYVEWGCAAVNSIAKGDNTLWLLGQSPTGGPAVIRMNGYVPEVISTSALTYQLTTYTTISDAIGFVYQQNKHLFYVLTFPTQGVTWVYDGSTQLWHERASLVSGVQTRWLPSCYAACYNKSLVGDFNSGNIYTLNLEAYTENGVAITRTIQTHPFYVSGDYSIFDRFQLDMDTTPGATLSQVNLAISKYTSQPSFASPKTTSVQNGTYGYRVYWNSLGIGRVWCFKITTSMNARFAVLGAIATVRTGGILKNANATPGSGQ